MTAPRRGVVVMLWHDEKLIAEIRGLSVTEADRLIDLTITRIHSKGHGPGTFKIDAWHEDENGLFLGKHFATEAGGITVKA